MPLVSLTIEQVIKTHQETVHKSGGGVLGHLNLGPLESALEHIQNDEYYPTFEDKLTHLFFSACKFHCFLDGNKRIAIVMCSHLLLLNGYLYCASDFIREMENISYYVADGKINKQLLKEIISAFILKTNDESLKLRILNAISEPA
jgi:death-on-curing protein